MQMYLDQDISLTSIYCQWRQEQREINCPSPVGTSEQNRSLSAFAYCLPLTEDRTHTSHLTFLWQKLGKNKLHL